MYNLVGLHNKLHRDNWQDAQKYAFPVQGLIFDVETPYVYSHIELISKTDFLERYSDDLHGNTPLQPDAIAIADLDKLGADMTSGFHRHEMGLVAMKEFLGALHVMVFKKGKGESKIAISNSNYLELEEGLTPCYAIGRSDLLTLYKRRINLEASFKSLETHLIQAEWVELFSTPIQKRTALQKVIFKLLEISYYSSNEIHAYSRMNDWFIALNHSLRRNNEESLDRSHMGRRLHILFKNILQIDVFGRKLTSGFGDLYDKVRNKTQHGLFSSEIELSPIDEDDFIALKQLFFEWICFLVEHEEARKLESISEVVDWLEAYRPNI